MNSTALKHNINPRVYSRGVTLIEALIALGVMVAGTAAVFGIHGHVTATNTMNRMELLATGLAQEKVEELRAVDYRRLSDEISTSITHKDPDIEITMPGLNNNRTLLLTRCWTLEEVTGLESSMIRARIGVFNGDADCNFASNDLLTDLTTYIARHDPRASARNLEDQLLADGDGQVIQGEPPKGGEDGKTTGGFDIYTEDGKVTGIYDPDSRQSLIPKNGGTLKYTQISGNILINDTAFDFDAFNSLRVRTEGAALCRRYYPELAYGEDGLANEAKDIPAIVYAGNELRYIQYSCVVADNWRRSIYLRLPSGYQSCVGHPRLQPEDEEEDLLLSAGRQYTGSRWTLDSEGNQVKVPAGMRGSDEPGASVIGSVCAATTRVTSDSEEGEPVVSEQSNACWSDEATRGWIPGGHHYFVKTSGDETQCAESMEVLSDIDDALGTWYSGILFRNPHKTYCSNDKGYTIDLGAPPTAEEQEYMTYCYSTTKVSGFIINKSLSTYSPKPTNNFDIINGGLDPACSVFGAFGLQGGGYHCAFSESNTGVIIEPVVEDEDAALKFDPPCYYDIEPLEYLHDKTLANFDILSGGDAVSCESLINDEPGTSDN